MDREHVDKAAIPGKTIYRLSIYHRCLRRLADNEIETVSSSALAKAAGVNPSQLRRDLTYLGQFGTRGLGYPVSELIDAIREVLGREHLQPVILVGAGNLGGASNASSPYLMPLMRLQIGAPTKAKMVAPIAIRI